VAEPLVVTATPTIMDGCVVRWYADLNAAETGHEMMSASRNGVRIRAYLHEVPPGAILDATTVHEKLRDADRAPFRPKARNAAEEAARALATHHRRGFGRHGQLEPIAPGNVDRWMADHAAASVRADGEA
jgi:hypothetical protein